MYNLYAPNKLQQPLGETLIPVEVFEESFKYSTLEATQGQMDAFFSQLPFKCYLLEVACVGD